MGTEIKLFRGVERSSFLIRRHHLLVYLKGSVADKDRLRRSQPDFFKACERVWKIRNAHMICTDIPICYAFILKCCGKKDCLHPRCHGSPIQFNWYENGPSIDMMLPVPVMESPRVIGKKNCDRCEEKVRSKGICYGHYKRGTLTNIKEDTTAPVPSIEIRKEFQKNTVFDEKRLTKVASACLLSNEDTSFYLDHLKRVQINRKKGVEKARKTREAKKQS